MKSYSDQEVKQFIEQQEANYQVTSKRSGYVAKEARTILKTLSSQTQEERMLNGRAQLEAMSKYN